MEQRRQCKGKAEENKNYERLMKWMADRCSEMEELKREHDMFNMHKNVRDVSGLYNKKAKDILEDTWKTIINEQEIIEIWIQYITELFEDDQTYRVM